MRPSITADLIQGDPILRPRDAAVYTGLTRSSLYRLVESGDLPRPIKLTKQSSGWRLSTLELFIAKHEAEVSS